jgi:hypothetical protein
MGLVQCFVATRDVYLTVAGDALWNTAIASEKWITSQVLAIT